MLIKVNLFDTRKPHLETLAGFSYIAGLLGRKSHTNWNWLWKLSETASPIQAVL